MPRHRPDHTLVNAPIRLQLIHPRPIERRALAYLLASEADIEVEELTPENLQAEPAIVAGGADVVLCAIPRYAVCRLPGVSPRDSFQIARLRTMVGETPAIAMIDNSSPTLISATLHFGFSGLLTADAPDDTLFKAVRTVAAGECFLDATAQAILLDPSRRDELIPADVIAQSFSEREAQVLNLLAAGKSNDEIAAAIAVSSSAVKQCLKQLFTKLGVSNRAAAVATAVAVWAYLGA